MSNDGLLPHFFSEIHENSHTMENKPFFGFVSLFAGLVPVSDLGYGKYRYFIGFRLSLFRYIGHA
jgi:hypothetical protein